MLEVWVKAYCLQNSWKDLAVETKEWSVFNTFQEPKISKAQTKKEITSLTVSPDWRTVL